MDEYIPNEKFKSILKGGVKRSSDFISQLTDYHGGPVRIEYILTVDIARAFLERGYEVEVEYLNRKLLNALVLCGSKKTHPKIGSMRTDIVVTCTKLIPLAMIEVKIVAGGSKKKIEKDLEKITETIDCMKYFYASKIRAASVFQVYVSGNASDTKTDRLIEKISKIEKKFKDAVEHYEAARPKYKYEFVSLQESNEGVVPTEVIEEADGEYSIGQNGYAVRYYAIIVTRKSEVTA